MERRAKSVRLSPPNPYSLPESCTSALHALLATTRTPTQLLSLSRTLSTHHGQGRSQSGLLPRFVLPSPRFTLTPTNAPDLTVLPLRPPHLPPAIQVYLAPQSPKLRRVLPYFTSKSAGEIIHTSSPPPAKKVAGGSPTLHLYVALAARKQGEPSTWDEKLKVTYTDGTELEVELDGAADSVKLLAKLERRANELKKKDEALAL